MEKKQWVLFALLWSYKIFRAALNKCTMFVHVETNVAFLDRLSQTAPIPNFTTIRLVAAEVTRRTDRRKDSGKPIGTLRDLFEKA